MTPCALSFDFEPDFVPAELPVNGRTPAARHASWTGAQAAVESRGDYLLLLLEWFGKCRRMTFADYAKFVGVEQNCLCSTWNAAKYELGWIVGTGEFWSYVKRTRRGGARVVHREIHQVTAKGRRAMKERLQAQIERIEARS